jgi:hypothetical protein
MNKMLWRELTAQASCRYLDAVLMQTFQNFGMIKVKRRSLCRGNAIPALPKIRPLPL